MDNKDYKDKDGGWVEAHPRNYPDFDLKNKDLRRAIEENSGFNSDELWGPDGIVGRYF